jgi:hypothetical protein
MALFYVRVSNSTTHDLIISAENSREAGLRAEETAMSGFVGCSDVKQVNKSENMNLEINNAPDDAWPQTKKRRTPVKAAKPSKAAKIRIHRKGER